MSVSLVMLTSVFCFLTMYNVLTLVLCISFSPKWGVRGPKNWQKDSMQLVGFELRTLWILKRQFFHLILPKFKHRYCWTLRNIPIQLCPKNAIFALYPSFRSCLFSGCIGADNSRSKSTGGHVYLHIYCINRIISKYQKASPSCKDPFSDSVSLDVINAGSLTIDSCEIIWYFMHVLCVDCFPIRRRELPIAKLIINTIVKIDCDIGIADNTQKWNNSPLHRILPDFNLMNLIQDDIYKILLQLWQESSGLFICDC